MDRTAAPPQTGSAEWIARVYREHAPALFRLAARLMGSAADAEDVLHDVFVRLPASLVGYEERGKLAAWLRRLTVRAALQALRRERRRREVPVDAAASVASREAPPAGGVDLERAVAALPPSLRAVLVLKQIEGYGHAEIAKELGITVGASRVRLARALEALRDAMR